MITKRSPLLKNLMLASRRFSGETTTTTSSDSEGPSKVKNIIDPFKNQYTDFLKNVSVYEEANEDTLKTMYYLNHSEPLKGYATQEGTDKYYRMSQYGE